MIEAIAQYPQTISVFVLFLALAFVISTETKIETDTYQRLMRQIDLWNKQLLEHETTIHNKIKRTAIRKGWVSPDIKRGQGE